MTYLVGAHWNWPNSNMYQQHMFTENKETNFEIYIYEESCPLKNLNLPISIKILIRVAIWQSLYLHDSYIAKFDYMNYTFA